MRRATSLFVEMMIGALASADGLTPKPFEGETEAGDAQRSARSASYHRHKRRRVHRDGAAAMSEQLSTYERACFTNGRAVRVPVEMTIADHVKLSACLAEPLTWEHVRPGRDWKIVSINRNIGRLVVVPTS